MEHIINRITASLTHCTKSVVQCFLTTNGDKCVTQQEKL